MWHGMPISGGTPKAVRRALKGTSIEQSASRHNRGPAGASCSRQRSEHAWHLKEACGCRDAQKRTLAYPHSLQLPPDASLTAPVARLTEPAQHPFLLQQHQQSAAPEPLLHAAVCLYCSRSALSFMPFCVGTGPTVRQHDNPGWLGSQLQAKAGQVRPPGQPSFYLRSGIRDVQ